MASVPRSIGVQQNFNKIPVLGLVAESSAAASPPANPVDGQFWYDSTNNLPMVRQNGAWVQASITGAELVANKGAAGGYAPLDASSNVPIANLPVAASGTSSATQIVRADDSRLSNSRTPSGAAGGSLTGTYPNPTLAANSVGASQVTNGSLTDAALAAANKDGTAATPSLRTLGTGSQQAMPGNTRLDTIAAPTTAVALNGQRITGLADGTAATDAVTKQQLDSVSSGLDVKASVRVATTANITLSGTQTIDGVAVVAGDRVLVKDQTTASANGIYVVAAGAWSRAADADSNAEVTAGMFTFVEEGTANADSGWVLATNGAITLGTTALTFTRFSSAAALTAGAGLVQNGNIFDVVGTANRITVAADSIDIAATYTGQTSITTVGTITTGTWQGTAVAVASGGTGATTAAGARANLGAVGKFSASLGALTAGTELMVTHGLGTKDVTVGIYRVADDYEEVLAVRAASTTQVGVTADIAYAANALRIVVTG